MAGFLRQGFFNEVCTGEKTKDQQESRAPLVETPNGSLSWFCRSCDEIQVRDKDERCSLCLSGVVESILKTGETFPEEELSEASLASESEDEEK